MRFLPSPPFTGKVIMIISQTAYPATSNKNVPMAVRGGQKKGRPGRRRRLKGEWGQETLEKEKPPIFGIMQRSGEVVITMLPNVQQNTIAPLIKRTIAKGVRSQYSKTGQSVAGCADRTAGRANPPKSRMSHRQFSTPHPTPPVGSRMESGVRVVTCLRVTPGLPTVYKAINDLKRKDYRQLAYPVLGNTHDDRDSRIHAVFAPAATSIPRSKQAAAGDRC